MADTFLRIEDMTPEQRAEHEECMANMPIRAICREFVRSLGEDADEGDMLAAQFEDLMDQQEQ
jgi:hypothetical protein